MSSGAIILLGAIAGLTIFLGLPVGRIRGLSAMWRAVLNAGAAGVLVFLLVETVAHAFEPVEEAVEEKEWAEFALRAPIFLVAFGVGLLGLVYYDRWMKTRAHRAESASVGPGAASVSDFGMASRVARLSEPKRIALFIAIGIGIHNFAEGLAIGQSAESGAVNLAVLLVIGFALHNATEGFGIVAPLTSEHEMPSWGFLIAMGCIAGLPTFVGTVIGQAWTNQNLEIAFLALAAGSILYVIVQLLRVAARLDHDQLHVMWGLFAGIALGLGTELVLVAAGL
ncbi:MAG: ZIP family metal transporter [Acidimicrobiia bacterium]|jgi:ZIP family zinc transporter